MNIGKVLNTSIVIVSFSLFLAVTLPVFNNADMSSFQAFILTPVLMMVAALGAAGLFHFLDWAHARLLQVNYRQPRDTARNTAKLPGADRDQPVKHADVGRWAA